MITIEDSNSDIFHINPFHVIYVKERIAHNLENGSILKEKIWKNPFVKWRGCYD